MVHLLVAPERAPVFLPVVSMNDWWQAVELESDQDSTKMWSCFLDVTLVRAPVIRVF